MSHQSRASVFVCLVTLASSGKALAWGGKGHATVNKVAITMVANPEAKKFLSANSEQVIQFANTPDRKWKSGDDAAKEKPMHWFEMDGYGESRLGDSLASITYGRAQQELGRDYTQKYGSAMWRVSDFYVQLVAAIKKGDYKKAVQVAGVMGHYVGDMTQPMHSSSDYDGQSINQPGVHKYYETTLVDRINDDHLFDTIQSAAGQRRSGLERAIGNDLSKEELQKISWNEASDAYNALSDVYKRFDRGSADDAWLSTDLQPRIARAAALLGKIWDVAFAAAGTRNLPMQGLRVSEPEWIPMNAN